MTDKEENVVLRRLLWLNHGHYGTALYCDDGEMQCNQCVIDFKRFSADEIEMILFKKNLANFMKTTCDRTNNSEEDIKSGKINMDIEFRNK